MSRYGSGSPYRDPVDLPSGLEVAAGAAHTMVVEQDVGLGRRHHAGAAAADRGVS